MKNDLIIALLGFVLSAIVAWMSSLTIMVFDLEKAHAVQEVLEKQQDEVIENHKEEHERMKAL